MRSAASSPLKSGMSTSSRHDGILRPRLGDRPREMRGAAVGKVVAIDRGDDDVVERERGDGAADLDRLVSVGRLGRAVRDVAVAARPRAGVAENHERRRAVVPALADVRAVGFLADRVQAERAHQPLEAVIVLRARRADLQPLGLGLPRLAARRLALLAAADEVERSGRQC